MGVGRVRVEGGGWRTSRVWNWKRKNWKYRSSKGRGKG